MAEKKTFVKNLVLVCFVILAAAATIVLPIILKTVRCRNTSRLQEGIAAEIIRFHVLANSNNEEDQSLKLKVRDKVVKELKVPLENVTSKGEARKIIKTMLPQIINTAEREIKVNGYSYPVTANLEQTYFPTKVYGDLIFPPGNYEALRVEIGRAEGRNWWCVMYPGLCFVNGSYTVVPESSKKKLQYVLTEEEYQSLSSSSGKAKIFSKKHDKMKIKLKFRIKELFCISK